MFERPGAADGTRPGPRHLRVCTMAGSYVSRLCYTGSDGAAPGTASGSHEPAVPNSSASSR